MNINFKKNITAVKKEIEHENCMKKLLAVKN